MFEKKRCTLSQLIGLFVMALVLVLAGPAWADDGFDFTEEDEGDGRRF